MTKKEKKEKISSLGSDFFASDSALTKAEISNKIFDEASSSEFDRNIITTIAQHLGAYKAQLDSYALQLQTAITTNEAKDAAQLNQLKTAAYNAIQNIINLINQSDLPD